eukprot:TRINITY_DN3791_c0_g1_i1.p1 TRINITY_DN3791_c0_g1~~TRINITY_DN3791_c0_g1_i1.p1  ORF type:complete len:417 (+),score=124.48 TRINITY_DN3791_c0_g1_i1:109-1251(+)
MDEFSGDTRTVSDGFEMVGEASRGEEFEMINELVIEFSGGDARIRGGTGQQDGKEREGFHMVVSSGDDFDIDVAMPPGFPRAHKPIVSLAYPPPRTVSASYLNADGTISLPELAAWEFPQPLAPVLRAVVDALKAHPPVMTKPGGFAWGWRGVLPAATNGQYPAIPAQYVPVENEPTELPAEAAPTPASVPRPNPNPPTVPPPASAAAFMGQLNRMGAEQLERLAKELEQDDVSLARKALDPSTTVGKLMFEYQTQLTAVREKHIVHERALRACLDETKDGAALALATQRSVTSPQLGEVKQELASANAIIAATKAAYAVSEAVPRLKAAEKEARDALEAAEEGVLKAEGDAVWDVLTKVYQPLCLEHNLLYIRASTMYR